MACVLRPFYLSSCFMLIRILFREDGVGVEVFFVLSGYLITSILIKEYKTKKSISMTSFYMRRFLILGPVFLLLLLVYVSILVLFSVEAKDHYIAISHSLYMMNFAQLFGKEVGYLGHTWSLATEEQFYIIWPLLIILFLRFVNHEHLAKIVIAMIIAINIWRLFLTIHGDSFHRIYYGFDTHADTILIGCFGALVSASRVPKAIPRTWFVPVIVLTLFAQSTPTMTGWMMWIGPTILAICSLWLIIALTSEGRM